MILLELILIAAFSGVFMIGLFGYYQPRINKMEKVYNDLNRKIKDKLTEMSTAEREEFFVSLSSETREFYNSILDGSMVFSGIHELNSMQEHITYSMQDMNNLDNMQFQEFTQWAMDESMKAVTPFDHGGYVQLTRIQSFRYNAS